MNEWRKRYRRYKEVFLNIVGLYKKRGEVQMFLEILLSLLTISVFGAFALRPTLATVASLVAEVKSKEEILTHMDKKIEAIAKIDEVEREEEGRIPLVASAIPKKASPEGIVKQIEGATTRNSLSVLSFSIAATTIAGEIPKEAKAAVELPEGATNVEFALSVQGEYGNLWNFLSDLENLRRPVALKTASITQTEFAGQPTIVLVATAATPYLVPKLP